MVAVLTTSDDKKLADTTEEQTTAIGGRLLCESVERFRRGSTARRALR